MRSFVSCRSFPVLLIFAGIFSLPAHALECDNVGTVWASQPDDTNDAAATACGDGAVAGGDDSTALGFGASSSGADSTALGKNASASGTFSVALGLSASASDFDAIAIGKSSLAGNDYDIAVGSGAISSGGGSVALGNVTMSSGISSVAIGTEATATATFSTALGFRAFADESNTVILGSIKDVNGGFGYASVGIGTTSPMAPLHVARSDGSASIMVEDTSLAVAGRTLFTLANAGNTKFEIMNTDAANSWAFTNSGSDFRVSLQGSGAVEFRVDNSGDAYLKGLLFENSDRHAKTNISPVNPDEVLAKVTRLPIAEWAYSKSPSSRHIGPMAQDFHAAFATGTSATELATMDLGGVAIASIQALAARNQALEQEVARLKSLEQEVADLRAVVTRLLPEVAQN